MANEVNIVVRADDKASRDLDRIAGKSKGLGGTLKSLAPIGLGASVAVGAVGAAALKMGSDFELAMAEVRTLMPQVSDEAFGSLRDDVLAFSKEMGIATSDAVPALYQAISAGVPQENVLDFMRTSAKAAIGGVTDLETAVDGISSVVNAYGEEVLDAADAADIMFTGVKLGKTNFEELSSSLFNVVPIAAAAGVSFEEVTAGLAALTAQGVPTSVATTQLRAAIQSLVAPTKRQRTMMDELGLSFDEAKLKEIGLSGAFKELYDATGGNMEQMRLLVGSVEGLQAVLTLGGSGADDFAAALDEMETSAGAVDTAFKVVDDTTSRKFAKSMNNLKVTMTEVGVKVLPVVTAALETLLPALARLGAWVETKVIPVIKEWYAEHQPEIDAALAEFKRIMEEDVIPIIKRIADIVEEYWPKIQAVVEEVWPIIENTILTTMNAIKDIINVVLAVLEGDWGRAWQGIKDLFTGIWDGILTDLKLKLEALYNLFLFALAALKVLVLDKGKEVGIKVVQGIWEGIQSLKDWLFEQVRNFATGIFNAIRDGLGSLWPFSPSKAGVDIGVGLVAGIAQGIQEGLGGANLNVALRGLGASPTEALAPARDGEPRGASFANYGRYQVVLPNVRDVRTFNREMDRQLRGL